MALKGDQVFRPAEVTPYGDGQRSPDKARTIFVTDLLLLVVQGCACAWEGGGVPLVRLSPLTP